MKPFVFPALLAAAAFISPARAQIVTFDTISEYAGDSTVGLKANYALSQTITDAAEITNMTYQFVTNGNPSGVTSNITAYFVQWNPVTNAPTSPAGTPLFTETFTVPPTNSGHWSTYQYADNSGSYSGYNVTLSIDQYLNPSNTYALILINSVNSNIGLIGIGNADGPGSLPNGDGNNPAFYYNGTQMGEAYRATNVSTLSAMTASSTDQNGSYGFSELDIVPGGNNLVPMAPVPEPRTAAAAICALFVMALVARRLYLSRREEALALPGIGA